VPLFIKVASKEENLEGSGEVRVSLNTKTSETKLSVNFGDKMQSSTTKFNLDATVKSSNTPIKIEKPAGAKPLAELLGPVYSQYLSALSMPMSTQSHLQTMEN
jgi:hypothetical protein